MLLIPPMLTMPDAATIASVTDSVGDISISSTTHTLVNRPIGAADGSRRIIVAVGQNGNTPGQNPRTSAVTVAGISTVQLGGFIDGVGSSDKRTALSMWMTTTSVPTGTSGDIVITHNNLTYTAAIAIFRLSTYRANYLAGAGNAGSVGSAAGAAIASTLVQAKGCIIGAGITCEGTGPAHTWSQLTEQSENPTSSIRISGAVLNSATSQNIININCTDTGSGAFRVVSKILMSIR